MDNYTVYMHVNKTNGKRYIGITSQVPMRRWSGGAGYKEQRRFYSAIMHYGWDSFDHFILETGLSKEAAERREAELIAEYKSNDLHYGYNMENGGVIHKLSEEQKEHLREVNLGKKLTEETRRKISQSQKGLSPQWLTGRKASASTKQKMSEKRRGAQNSRAVAVEQYDLNGQFIARYEYMELAKKAVGAAKSAHISRCCSGARKTAYGFIWKYAKE